MPNDIQMPLFRPQRQNLLRPPQFGSLARAAAFKCLFPGIPVWRATITLILAAAFTTASTLASVLELEGTVEQQARIPGAAEISPDTYVFSGSISGCRWRFRLTPNTRQHAEKFTANGNQYINLPSDYELASSDGTNFYYVVSVESQLSALARKTGHPSGNRSNITRGPGTVPFHVRELFILLWYAYASQCYFTNAEPSRIYPLEYLNDQDYQQPDFRVRAYWTLMEGSPGLPRFIQTSNYVRFPQNFPAGLPLQLGANTNVIYHVLTTTNVNGLLVPRRASAQYYVLAPSADRIGVASRKAKTTNITLNRVRETDRIPDFRPTFPGPALLQDIRFWTNDPPLNISRAGVMDWPDGSEMAALKAQQLARMERNRPRKPTRIIILAALLLIGTVIGAVMMRGGMRKQKTENESQGKQK